MPDLDPREIAIANPVREAQCIKLDPVCAGIQWKLWAAAVLSAGLLELPFPLAGPMPPWRSIFAWFGLVPLLWAILSPATVEQPRPLRRAFLLVVSLRRALVHGQLLLDSRHDDALRRHAAAAPTLLLIGFSLVLGLYFGFFGLGVMLVRRATGSTRLALAAAPFLWAALELAAARITSVPWDQLGYSQVDNALVNQLAPWTGVYGISFVLVAVNALSPAACCSSTQQSRSPLACERCRGAACLLITARRQGSSVQPATARTHRHRRADPAQSRCGR